MPEEWEELHQRWPLLEQFKLPKDSTILVVGAYKGLAMEALAHIYPDYKEIIGFEPQMWAAAEATARVAELRDCIVCAFGLGAGVSGTFPMGEWHTDACSFINVGEGSREQGEGFMMDANLFLASLTVPSISFISMNIEGYEFELIPYLRQKDWLKKIDRLAVQWHLGLGSNPKTMEDVDKEIQTLIDEDGYKLVYDERPAWSYFEPAWVGGDA